MTRAMKKLYLSCAEHRHLHGQNHYHAPSRFISEIPQTLLQRVHPKLSTPKSNAYASENASYFTESRAKKVKTKNTYIKSSKENSGFSLGQRVTHEKFGAGTILDCEGSGETARVQIRFEKHGTKWLVLKFASLKNG